MLGSIYAATIGVAGAYYVSHNIIRKSVMKYRIKADWVTLMEAYSRKVKNKLEQEYKLLEIYLTKYGFNGVISIPYGLDLNSLRGLIPTIETTYGGSAILELSESGNSGYIRVHMKGFPIDLADEIRFKWYTVFSKGEFRTTSGSTYKIENIRDTVHPTNKDIVGYNLEVSVPSQMCFDNMISAEGKLSDVLGLTYCKWDRPNLRADIQVVTKPLSNNEEFQLVKVKPWEFYCGMMYNYKPIIFDYRTSPSCLVGGSPGSGKTVALIMGLMNLCCQYRSDTVQLFIGLTADKQDFRIFKNTENCKYYARTIDDCIKLMKYLMKEARKRNGLFEAEKKFMTNVHEYNKAMPKNKKLPLLYFATDEIANFMPTTESGANDPEKKKKVQFLDLFRKVAREGRSAGIYLNIATQRGDKTNMDSTLKGMLSNKICFHQPNTASALTIVSGEQASKRVMKLIKSEREFLVEYDKGSDIGKTLCLTTDMMEEFLQPRMIKNKVFLEIEEDGTVQTPEEKAKNKKGKSRYEKNREKKRREGFF